MTTQPPWFASARHAPSAPLMLPITQPPPWKYTRADRVVSAGRYTRIARGPPGPGIVRSMTEATGSGAALNSVGRPRASSGVSVEYAGWSEILSIRARADGVSRSGTTVI